MRVTELLEEYKVTPDSLINYQVGSFIKDYIAELPDDVEVSKIGVRTVGNRFLLHRTIRNQLAETKNGVRQGAWQINYR